MAQTFSSTRLYIGNLATSCDEYTLIQLCSKHGKIAKLDYLFHKTGPAKGKPRGYAFIEYSTKEVRPRRTWVSPAGCHLPARAELTPSPVFATPCLCPRKL